MVYNTIEIILAFKRKYANLTYKEIQKIEISATKKLLNYI